MFLGRSFTSIGQIWRAVQQTNIVSLSINSSQIAYAGSNLKVKSKSCAGDQSITMNGDKRIKVQKSIWRPVAAQSLSTEVVDGPSIESVTRGAAMIKNVLDEAVKGPNLQYSHFVSLPLAVHPTLVEKLTNFQNSILTLSGCVEKEVMDSGSASTAESSEDDSEDNYKVKVDVEDDNVGAKLDLEGVSTGDMQVKPPTFYSQAKKNFGIDKSIFIKPATFHLTVLMLKLWNKERVAAAAEVLQKVSSQVKEALENRPVAVRLKGLEIMRGKLEKAHVLYAPVEEVGGGERLQHACRVIIDAFVEAGLVMQKDATVSLKLHATLMNTSHRKKNNFFRKKFRKSRRNFPFDARHIMEIYGSENWGEFVIHDAHLSQRFEYDDHGYYHCCSSIPFPKTNERGDGTADTTKEHAKITDEEMAEASAKEADIGS